MLSSLFSELDCYSVLFAADLSVSAFIVVSSSLMHFAESMLVMGLCPSSNEFAYCSFTAVVVS